MVSIENSPDHSHIRNVERKVESSSDIFRLLVDAVEDYAIFALDPTGQILTWNSGAERLKGYTASEVIGSNFSRFYTERDIARDHPASELKQAERLGKYEEDGWRVRKNGELFWANVVITAIREKNGTLRGFGKVTRDLTARKREETKLRESEERFRLMVSDVSDYAIIMLDTEGKVSSWNVGAERIKGYRPAEILGRHFSAFYPKSDLDDGKPEMELRVATAEGRYEEEGWRVRKDGSMFWANVTITAMRGDSVDGKPGQLRGFAKVTRDLTERKRAEDELRAAYATLEQRVALRTSELTEAKVQAEAAVKSRDQFFSIASHELKTPLSSLKLQAQIRSRMVAKGDFSDFAPDKLADLCEDDERQIGRLAFLVDNLLDISKLTSGMFELSTEDVDIGQLIADSIKRMDPLLRETGNICSLRLPDQQFAIHCDRHRIDQVLSNLLSNASKYAPNARVSVSLRDTSDGVEITVADEGPGIPEVAQSRIFKAFERGSAPKGVSGLGLGLFIVKQIVEEHGGFVQLTSCAGKGAAFTVTLPRTSSVAKGPAS